MPLWNRKLALVSTWPFNHPTIQQGHLSTHGRHNCARNVWFSVKVFRCQQSSYSFLSNYQPPNALARPLFYHYLPTHSSCPFFFNLCTQPSTSLWWLQRLIYSVSQYCYAEEIIYSLPPISEGTTDQISHLSNCRGSHCLHYVHKRREVGKSVKNKVMKLLENECG